MITCSVCGHLNDSSNAICERCGSDLSDSEDWGNDFDDDNNNDDFDLNNDYSEDMGYYDDDYYD